MDEDDVFIVFAANVDEWTTSSVASGTQLLFFNTAAPSRNLKMRAVCLLYGVQIRVCMCVILHTRCTTYVRTVCGVCVRMCGSL
jgi:hypothetical protein